MVPQENGKRSLPGTLVELKGEGVLNLDLVKCLKGNPFHCSVKSPPLPLPCGILSGIKWRLSLQTSGAPQSPAPTQTKKTAPFLQHFCHIWQETSVLCMWQAALMGCTQKTSIFASPRKVIKSLSYFWLNSQGPFLLLTLKKKSHYYIWCPGLLWGWQSLHPHGSQPPSSVTLCADRQSSRTLLRSDLWESSWEWGRSKR